MRRFETKDIIFYSICVLLFLGFLTLFILGLIYNRQLNIEEMGHQIEEYGFYKKDVRSAWFYESGAYRTECRNVWFVVGGAFGFVSSFAVAGVKGAGAFD